MKVIQGVRNQEELRKASALLSLFRYIDLTEMDVQSAMTMQLEARLRLNIGVVDYLVAAMTLRLDATLYTRNLKHFTPLIGALAIQPY